MQEQTKEIINFHRDLSTDSKKYLHIWIVKVTKVKIVRAFVFEILIFNSQKRFILFGTYTLSMDDPCIGLSILELKRYIQDNPLSETGSRTFQDSS